MKSAIAEILAGVVLLAIGVASGISGWNGFLFPALLTVIGGAALYFGVVGAIRATKRNERKKSS